MTTRDLRHATEEDFLKEYRRIAAAMEGMRKAWLRRISYHLLADAIYWSDEIPAGLDSFSENCLRTVLRYRTTLVAGNPDPEWEPDWTEALRQFPKWIGFLPERTTANTRLTRTYQELRADAFARSFRM